MRKKDDDKTPQALETDERFPSGEWTGFWMQRSVYGGERSWMELQLTFAGGILRGEGRDRIGEFTILGRYDLKSGEVTFTKTHPTHDVHYRGWAELDKGIWGLWKLPFDRDGFHIWPKGMADPTGSKLKAEADAPVEEEEPALVGSANVLSGSTPPSANGLLTKDWGINNCRRPCRRCPHRRSCVRRFRR